MIGQESNVKKLNKFFDTHNKGFIVITGNEMSGRNTIIKETYKHNISFVGYKTSDIDDVIESVSSTNENHLYYFEHCDLIANNNFNKLLKTLEETKDGIFFVMEYDSKIPETIMTRCNLVINMQYNIKVVKDYCNDIDITCICDNIGQVEYFKKLDIKNIQSLTQKIFSNLCTTSLGNALKLDSIIKEMDFYTILKYLKFYVIKNINEYPNDVMFKKRIDLLNLTLSNIRLHKQLIEKEIIIFILHWRKIYEDTIRT